MGPFNFQETPASGKYFEYESIIFSENSWNLNVILITFRMDRFILNIILKLKHFQLIDFMISFTELA